MKRVPPAATIPNVAVLHQQALSSYHAGDRQRAGGLWRVVQNADRRHSDSVFMLGVLALEAGNPEAALVNLDSAIGLRPRAAVYHDTRGDALQAMGAMPEAMDAWRAAIRFDPNLQAPLVSLGCALTEAGEPAEAAKLHRRALMIDPRSPAALNGLGLALLRLHDPAGAEAALRAAVKEAPALAAIHGNLGTLLREQNRLAEAESCLETARNLAPGNPAILYNLALNRLADMRMADGEALLREALAAEPNHAEAHHTLAMVLLASGGFDEGWEHYEWRRLAAGLAPRLPGPNWNGEDLAGRTLLVMADEGLGDFLNFCRFLPLAARQGTVIVEVPPALMRIALRLPGISQVVPAGQPLPPHDVHCSATSLWRAFRAKPDHMPATAPYVFADRHDTADWRHRLAGLPGRKVGLARAGNPTQQVDPIRSIPAALLQPLAGTPGVSFVSLQLNPPLGDTPGLTLFDGTKALLDLADTAAMIESLDLVISVDTAVAHLAGAAGRPVWLLNRWDGDTDPRWMQGRADSYWYPSMRIFRQPARGDWQSVINHVRLALEIFADA